MNKKIKVILCTGDSHTVGQGAQLPRNLPISFANPPRKAGDLRPYPFEIKGYVSLLRDYINAKTCSSAWQIFGQSVFDITDVSLIRIIFKIKDIRNKIRIIINGKEYKSVNLKQIDTNKCYTPLIICNDNGKSLEIQNINNGNEIYCAEFYAGDWAVINSGIGSCTTENFINTYKKKYVDAFTPEIIVAEAHSINDWIHKIPLEMSKQNLLKIINYQKRRNKKTFLVTVAPILGTQNLPYNKIDYADYIRICRELAQQEGIQIADVNYIITSMFRGKTKEECSKLFYSDNWHVNSFGHRIYFDEIIRLFDFI
jgi:lysophospholipase L1-like esterase